MRSKPVTRQNAAAGYARRWSSQMRLKATATIGNHMYTMRGADTRMLARALACVRPRVASTYSSSFSSPCLRRMQFSGNSAGAFKKPVRLSAALAIAVSCAAAGGLFTSQAAPSESRHPSPAVIASVPPSATTYATSGVVPSGASPLALSYSAGESYCVARPPLAYNSISPRPCSVRGFK